MATSMSDDDPIANRHPILYINEISPPCRAVTIVGKIVGIEFKFRHVKMVEGEVAIKELQQVNPHLTVPALNDDGYHIWTSHAIICYLCDKYGGSDEIYPSDQQQRALVHQRLFFEDGMLFSNARAIGHSIISRRFEAIIPLRIRFIAQAFGILENFLEGKKWLLEGDHFTIADITCATTVSSLDVFYSLAEFPNINRWLKTCEEEIPSYKDLNRPGNEKFKEMFQRWMSES